MMRLVILFLVITAIGCSGSVLPPDRTLLELEDAKLREMILHHVPLGTPRPVVEQTFSHSFQRRYKIVDYESAEMIAKRGFSVPVVAGDYYLRSELASKLSGVGSSRIVTVYLLFNAQGRLKDIAVRKWTDSL